MSMIEETYSDMLDLVDCLVDGKKLHALIISSPAGLGKTYNTVKHLQEKRGLTLFKDFVVVSGYITPMEFYKLIFDYHNKLIVIDDTDSVLSSEETISMLLAMLWSPAGKRIVHYASSTSKLDGRPTNCNFSGKIIILTNNVPRRLEAFKSRCFYYCFDISRDNRIAMMYEMAKEDNIPVEIVDFIKAATTDKTPQMDFRLLSKLHSIYTTKNDRWRKLGLALIRADDDILRLIAELAMTDKSVKDQAKAFVTNTKLSERTFYNRRKELGLTANSTANETHKTGDFAPEK